MKNANAIEELTQGVDPQNVPAPDVEKIEKWLIRDLDACLSLLTAIRQDTELRHQMAIWFEGRITNYKNKPTTDPSQTNIFNEPKPSN